jgi:hypothetical protein
MLNEYSRHQGDTLKLGSNAFSDESAWQALAAVHPVIPSLSPV